MPPRSHDLSLTSQSLISNHRRNSFMHQLRQQLQQLYRRNQILQNLRQQQQQIRMLNPVAQEQQRNMPIVGYGSGNQPGVSSHNSNDAPSAQPAPTTSDINNRVTSWSGTIEWLERSKQNDQKISHKIPFSVIAIVKEDESAFALWPSNICMKLIPVYLVRLVGAEIITDSKKAIFVPKPCEALASLLKLIRSGYVGYVHLASSNNCGDRVLLLIYSVKTKMYVGLKPNNQAAFVERLHEELIKLMQLLSTANAGNMQPQQQIQGTMGEMMQQNVISPNDLTQQQ